MVDQSWQARFAMLILKLLHLVSKVLAAIGEFLEIFLNTVYANGGLSNLVQKLLTGRGIIIPDEDSDSYWSVIGFLDPRTDLLVHQLEDQVASHFVSDPPGSKLMADVCMMASKLAYENSKIIRKIITNEWKMHVVDIYECINKNEPTNPTQVLIFMDRAVDAQAVFVVFRGTMPFNASDWSTDFDFSWYLLPGIGRVHVGFLEALSLVDRHDMDSFTRMKDNVAKTRASGNATSSSKHTPASGLIEALKVLLRAHRNAKVYVTGHSLGGALATVFTTILFHNKENTITGKLGALYTFGQPRVGDKEFAATMTSKLNGADNRFFRVVYSADLIPRVPFDDFLFQFKHIEPCFFYTSFYTKMIVKEEPNKNYFNPFYYIFNHAVAVWELLQSFVLHFRYGDNYRESSSSTVLRLVGLFFPGVSAHSPVNYVNSVRLGPAMLDTK
ncbi:hypothetical protein SELMODRAFT_186412 [Selaginella moellendorffii]|uniref:Fungal lipase-type domain-containing protein n=1 Tax=Selaginella moellendorffii TaxID=88036 RepID=D8T8D5_SELML|nr:hypothetical protein SELMODRAFT_136293 [Selaginella moellendorffii]EFJ07120.1 hypothetical protein SELMODRAFT_186412 [Selaginella moellendorffii]